MQFFKLLKLGFTNYWNGLTFIIKHKLYWYILFPVALFVAIFLLGNYFKTLGFGMTQDVQQNISEITTINGLILKTVKIIFFDQLHFLFTKFTMYFVIMCLAPVLAIVSEKIEEVLTGNRYKWNLLQILKDIKRAAILNIRLILVEYVFILFFLGIATFFGGPAKWWVAYGVPFVIGFYFYGFGYIDYVLERRRLNIKQTVHFVSHHKGLAFALGSIYASCFLSFDYVWRKFSSLPSDNNTQILWGTILVVLFILAVSAPILAIASATLSMHEVIDLSTNEYADKQVASAKSANHKNTEASNADTSN